MFVTLPTLSDIVIDTLTYQRLQFCTLVSITEDLKFASLCKGE